MKFLSNITPKILSRFCWVSFECEAGIAERVSALDWLSLRYAAIIM